MVVIFGAGCGIIYLLRKYLPEGMTQYIMYACSGPAVLQILCQIYYRCKLCGYVRRRDTERKKFSSLMKDPYFSAGRLKEQQKLFLTALIRTYDSSPMGRNMVQSIWMRYKGPKNLKAGPPVQFVKEYYTALNIPDLALEAPVLQAAKVSIGSQQSAVDSMIKCLLYTRVVVKRDIDRTRIRFAFSNETYMPVVANAEFEKADEDGGGTLDMDEIVNLTIDLTRRFKIKALPSDEIMSIFRKRDVRGRQELDKKEFLPFLRDVLKLSLDAYDKAQADLLARFSAEETKKRTKKIMRVKKDEKEKLLAPKEQGGLQNFLIFVGAAEPEKRVDEEFSLITDDYSNEFVDDTGLNTQKLMEDISDVGDDWEASERSAFPFDPALFNEVGGEAIFQDIAGFEKQFRKYGDHQLEKDIEVAIPSQPLKYRRQSAWVLPGDPNKGEVIRRLREMHGIDGAVPVPSKGKGKGKGRGRGKGKGKAKGKGTESLRKTSSPPPVPKLKPVAPPPRSEPEPTIDVDDVATEVEPEPEPEPAKEENIDDMLNEI